MRHPRLGALLASALVLMSVAAVAANERVRTEYYLINGPEYRQVSKAVFEEYRGGHSCMRIETKFYPESGADAAVWQSHCYL